MLVTVNCPYCGTKRTLKLSSANDWENEVLICDTEEGGCDQPYVVLIRIKADVTIKGIEGYSAPIKKDGTCLECGGTYFHRENCLKGLDFWKD